MTISEKLVTKSNGKTEPFNFNKIIKSISRTLAGLSGVDEMAIATRVIAGAYDRLTTAEIDALTVDVTIGMIKNHPVYSKAAARFQMNIIDKEVQGHGVMSFSQSMEFGTKMGLVDPATTEFVLKNRRKLDSLVTANYSKHEDYDYFGIRTLHDRYLLRHPETRTVFETPIYMLMRVACGIHINKLEDVIALFEIYAAKEYLSSTPTLFNSGLMRMQMSSCYVLDSAPDDLDAIYEGYKQVALLSKFAGGIGQDWTRIRAEGALIKGTNGISKGIIPFIATQNLSTAAVNQGGKRKGAVCAYLESFHPDIEAFNELRKNTGDPERRAHHMNIANWVPNLLMDRAINGGMWTMISPDFVSPSGLQASKLHDTFGAEFNSLYLALESELADMPVKPRWYKQEPASKVYGWMMTSLTETGNGWMTFKDRINECANQTASGKYVVHSSNLCTEITLVNDKDNVSVCNLGSVNLLRLLNASIDRIRAEFAGSGRPLIESIDLERLERVVRVAVRSLDRVIDRNFYPIEQAKNSNMQWRPVGLGIMGWQDVLIATGTPFDDPIATEFAAQIQAAIYYFAVSESVNLARELGKFPLYDETHHARGKLHYDLFGVENAETLGGVLDWDALKAEMAEHGTRNSLLLAIAPTATIASIVGVWECTEPMYSNLFRRETLSGEFIQVNDYLVADLEKLGLWDAAMYEELKQADGSIQGIQRIPPELRLLYRTAWEISMRPVIDQAVARGAYIDQAQSLNLYMESPTIGKASSMYKYAYDKGAKTTYYLRSRGATTIAKTSAKTFTAQQAVTCSLENPESCEACQ